MVVGKALICLESIVGTSGHQIKFYCCTGELYCTSGILDLDPNIQCIEIYKKSKDISRWMLYFHGSVRDRYLCCANRMQRQETF